MKTSILKVKKVRIFESWLLAIFNRSVMAKMSIRCLINQQFGWNILWQFQVFMSKSGKNVTPPEMGLELRTKMLKLCDAALCEVFWSSVEDVFLIFGLIFLCFSSILSNVTMLQSILQHGGSVVDWQFAEEVRDVNKRWWNKMVTYSIV